MDSLIMFYMSKFYMIKLYSSHVHIDWSRSTWTWISRVLLRSWEIPILKEMVSSGLPWSQSRLDWFSSDLYWYSLEWTRLFQTLLIPILSGLIFIWNLLIQPWVDPTFSDFIYPNLDWIEFHLTSIDTALSGPDFFRLYWS